MTSARRSLRARRVKLLLSAALLVTAGVVAAAVILARSGTNPSAAAPSRAPGGDAERAPAFSLAAIDGRRFSLAAARRHVVVVDFLAPGCPSCAASLPPLAKTATRFRARGASFVIVDVSGANDSKALRDYYYGQYSLPRAVLIGEDRGFRIARAYGANQLGMTAVIDGDGRISWQGMWGSDASKLAAAIEGALAR